MSIERSWAALAASDEVNPPASAEDLARVEAVVGARLPEEIRASLLLHDGLPPDSVFDVTAELETSPVNEWILSCEEIIAEWDIWKGLYDEEDWGDTWWTPNLVPLTADGSGNSIVVDVADGELRFMDREDGVTPCRHGSWAAYLEVVARTLAA